MGVVKAVRRPKEATAALEWSLERDVQVARAIASGLGVRPPQWWQYDSGRPDLAAGADLDTYAHLRGGPHLEAAKVRLRHLASSGELRDSERAQIALGVGPAYEWRQQALQSERVN